MKISKYFLVFISFMSLFQYSYWNIENEKQNCFELIRNYDSSIDLKKSIQTNVGATSNDGISGVDFLNIDVFNRETYNFWEKSQLSRKDIFRIFELYGIDLWQSFFYDTEVNFYNISHNQKESFLSCSLVKNKHLLWKLSQLKKWDVTVAYSTYPENFIVKTVKGKDKNYKQVEVKRVFKDTLGKKDVLEINMVYFVPENNELKNYYDLYNMTDKSKEINDWYKTRIENTDLNSPNIKEIYNNNGLEVKRYFVWGKPFGDPFWIRYVFINGINFFNDYNEYRRHHLFEYLLSIDSPLAKSIYIVENKWDEVTKWYVEPQLDFIWWINYFLWRVDIDEETKNKLIDVQPYYTREVNYLNNTYYKVENKVWRTDYRMYLFNTLFTEENKKDPDILLANIKKVSIEDNYQDLTKTYEQFQQDFEKIKDSNNQAKRQEFTNKYAQLFPFDKIFQENKDLLENVSIVQEEKIIQEEKGINLNYIFILIGIIVLWIISTIIIKRK